MATVTQIKASYVGRKVIITLIFKKNYKFLTKIGKYCRK
jgi:hypothetical protein